MMSNPPRQHLRRPLLARVVSRRVPLARAD